MENVTLGQIAILIGFIITLVSGVKYILNDIGKIVEKALKPTNDRITQMEKNLSSKIEEVDMNACKNFLVAQIDMMQKGEIDAIAKERFFEQYEHYIKLGGNSYIKNEVDNLKKIGRL